MKFPLATLVLSLARSSMAAQYCQPEDSCWPTPEEISAFAASINPATSDCLGSFASAESPGEYVDNHWYPGAPDRITIYELANLRNKVYGIWNSSLVLSVINDN